MLKFQAEITDMLIFGRNYCCSRRVCKKHFCDMLESACAERYKFDC